MEGCRKCSAQAPVKASGEGEHEPKGAGVVEDEEEEEVGEVVVKEERSAEQEVKKPPYLTYSQSILHILNQYYIISLDVEILRISKK